MSHVLSVSPLSGLRSFRLAAPRRRIRKNGFSLVELLVVAGVIAMVMLAVFVLFPVVRNSFKAGDEANFYQTMSSDTRTVYSTQGSFVGVNPSNLIKLGVVPSTMVRGNTIVSGFDTVIGVAPANVLGNANDGVEFTYTLPRDVCTKFVQKAAQASTRVVVGAQTVLNRATGINAINVSTLATGCDSAVGGNVVIRLAQGR